MSATHVFSDRVALLRRYYELANLGREGEFLERHLASDVRVITRLGDVHGDDGRRYLEHFLALQRHRFVVQFDPKEFIDAGEDTVVAFLEVTRTGHTREFGRLMAWPAHVFRFRGDQVARFEGYQDRRDALRDLGVVQSPEEPAQPPWWRRVTL